jgi:DNA-binding response OmpR family regulator
MKVYRTIERPLSQRNRTNTKPSFNGANANRCIRVVVADDNEHIRKLMGLIFNIPSGYTVRFAEDGEDAWVSLTAEPFDLLVTDIDMPRLNGIQLVRRMRNHSFLQPVIFVSGCLPKDADASFRRLAPCDGLEKPFSFKDLLTRSAAMTQYNARNGTNGTSRNGTNGSSRNGTNGGSIQG